MLRVASLWTNDDNQPQDSPSGARVGGAGRSCPGILRYLVKILETSFAEWSGLGEDDPVLD